MILYEPDKSTKLTVATLLTSLPGLDVYNIIMKIQWERVDSSFFYVLQTTRFVSPTNSKSIASYKLLAKWIDKFYSFRFPYPSYKGLTFGRSSSALLFTRLSGLILESNRSYPTEL